MDAKELRATVGRSRGRPNSDIKRPDRGIRFAHDSPVEEDGFELLVPVVKRRPPREMEPGLCRTGPHFQRRMMALEGSFRFSHSARSSSGIFVSVSGYPRQR
jgi:hypothetical protein